MATKLTKITDLTFMTNLIWKTLDIPVEDVRAGLGTWRSENAQYLIIKNWLEEFGEDDLLFRIRSAVRDFNQKAENQELRKVVQDLGLRDNFYKTAEEQAKDLR